MKEMTLDEIKKTQLGILIYIDKVCRENGIKYSLGYGTLLGAVRHKGFIPWDDDIDIILKRLDYNKLINTLYEIKDDRYRVFTMNDKGYFYPYAKVSDNKTVIKEQNWPDYDDLGVNIDIFPIDFVPEERDKAYYEETQYRIRCLYNCLTDIAYAHNKKYMRLLKKICRYWQVRKCRKQNEWYWKNKIDEMTQLNDSNLVANLVLEGYHSWQSNLFDGYIELEFENHMFDAVEDYDTMLKSYYGDYMQLPPENERVSNHDFTAYWKE